MHFADMFCNIVNAPEASAHMSIKSRIDHCAAQGKLETLMADSHDATKINVEQGHWLFPIQDRVGIRTAMN